MGLLSMILWCVMGLLIACQYAPYCAELKWWEQGIVCVIFLVGGPFFIVANIMESLLNVFLPEGWDDDNEGML